MNKALKIISYIFFILILLGCSGKYKKKQGKIYFSYWASPGDKIVLEVEGVDAKSFATLRFKGYAADKNHVYWRGRIIENADANTFKPLSWSYSIDGKHVFYKDKILSASDPQTFQILENEYTLDCDSVYFKGKTMAGADSKTFNTIGHYYGKDKNAIYRLGQILNEIEDPETFRLLAPPEKKDKNSFDFFKAEKTDYLDRWGRDKANYYREGRKIKGIDYSTFTLLDDGYGSYVRDRYHVFYCEYPHSFIIEGADTETFEILNKYMDTAKDRNHYYEYGKIVAPPPGGITQQEYPWSVF
jgi:hypothetical protein